jgi:hypothetical protein
VPGNSRVAAIEKQGEWAKVLVSGTTQWVDGRALLPPTIAGAPAASRTTTSSTKNISTKNITRKNISTNDAWWSVLSALAGLGVLVGAVTEWISSSLSINSFDLPMAFLFDKTSLVTEREPRIGYFVATFGVVAILTSFSEGLVWVRRIAGLLTLVIAALFCFQVRDLISQAQHSVFSSSNVDFFSVVGIGPFIAGVCGLGLVVLPRP